MREDVMTMGTIATTNVEKATIEISMNGTIHWITTGEGMLYDRYGRDYSPSYNQRREDQRENYEDWQRQGNKNRRFLKKRNFRKEDRREPAKEYQ